MRAGLRIARSRFKASDRADWPEPDWGSPHHCECRCRGTSSDYCGGLCNQLTLDVEAPPLRLSFGWGRHAWHSLKCQTPPDASRMSRINRALVRTAPVPGGAIW